MNAEVKVGQLRQWIGPYLEGPPFVVVQIYPGYNTSDIETNHYVTMVSTAVIFHNSRVLVDMEEELDKLD